MNRFTILGSGTSTGVPSVACDCETCRSSNPKDKRLRTSLLIQSESTTVVIDTSLDFRQQMLSANVMHIDGIVYTHHHFDHIGGFDDIRPYNFSRGSAMPIYAMAETAEVLATTFPYAFGRIESTGAAVPSVEMNEVDSDQFSINDISLIPIPLRHGPKLRVNGYRIGDVAYCTDTNFIPEDSMALLQGLDVLILDGLRHKKHPTHFTVEESLMVIEVLRPKKAYLTHIAHQLKHEPTNASLPQHVELAYDGLSFSSGDSSSK